MSVRKCKCELSDLLPDCEQACISPAAQSGLDASNETSPNVIASASCDGHVLRLQFEIKLDVTAIRQDEPAYLRSILKFTTQFEKILKDSGLENYLKQK